MKTTHRILSTRLGSSDSLIRARDRTRQVGELCGLDDLQRTRFITAVSEIARNAVQYAGGGSLEFHLREASADRPQSLVAKVVDDGPGISHLNDILQYRHPGPGKTCLGIAGSRRLVDHFSITCPPGKGTCVVLEMRIPPSAGPIRIDELSASLNELLRRREQTPTDELEQQNREMLLALEALRERQIELQEADERKDEFLAMLAHELRNPLSAISSALEQLRRKRNLSPSDLERLSSLMSRQTEQLARLVNDLLDVSRVTRGKIDLSMEPVSLRKLVEHALEMTHNLIEEKGHSVELCIASDEVVWINADPVRFNQILGNLIHNAVRYTPPNGKVAISLDREGDVAIVRIQDNGVGITPDMLPRIFDLFVQAKTGLDRQNAGLGVGLTLVQTLVGAHGGSIEAASDGPGQGSTFTVRIPVSHVEPAPTPAPCEAPASAGTHRVLVIDDNIDVGDALQQMLEIVGYQAMVARTGEQGLKAARENCPSIVIVDIGLPGMDGFEVAAALRAQPETSKVFIIAVSGYSVASMASRIGAENFDVHLEKPVSFQKLEAVLASAPTVPEPLLDA